MWVISLMGVLIIRALLQRLLGSLHGLFLLNLLHHLDSFFLLYTALFCLPSEFERQVFPGNVSFRLFFLLLVSLEFLSLLGLRSQSFLLVELGTACELVPHFPGTLHEILILDLFEPPLGQSTILIEIGGIIGPLLDFKILLITDPQLRIVSAFLSISHDRLYRGHFNRVFP